MHFSLPVVFAVLAATVAASPVEARGFTLAVRGDYKDWDDYDSCCKSYGHKKCQRPQKWEDDWHNEYDNDKKWKKESKGKWDDCKKKWDDEHEKWQKSKNKHYWEHKEKYDYEQKCWDDESKNWWGEQQEWGKKGY